MHPVLRAAAFYAYTAECFPTEIRSSGTGFTYGIGRLSNAFGPLLIAVPVHRSYGYMTVFSLHRRLLAHSGRDHRSARAAHQRAHPLTLSPRGVAVEAAGRTGSPGGGGGP